MAGKRILDAARLINVSSSIAKQHWSIRRQQWDHYTKTSGLGKAIKDQTDRVTVTAGAAWDLLKRVNETGPAWQNVETQARETYTSSKEAVDNTIQKTAAASEEAKSALRKQTSELADTQESKSNETKVDDGASSLRKRELQHAAERHIPEVTAESPLQDPPQGVDTYSERAGVVTPDLSSLPRAKLPAHSEAVQPSSPEINADVFYDTKAESIDTQVFHSPRIAAMLTQQNAPKKDNPYANRTKLPPKPLPEMVVTHGQSETKARSHESDGPVKSESIQDVDRDTQQMASEIAQSLQDAESATPAASFLRSELRESRVPASRFGRLWQYGGLATGMAFGAVGEGFRRLTGGGGDGNLMLSEANMNRLVAKLSRMRGAALKLGQMMSFQDSKVLPATINAVLQRVQDSADYMPATQRDQVMVRNLGTDWRDLFAEFSEKPFAAASIGQVHKARLASNGKEVAVKIQYPGVRNSIDSDLNNLSLLLTASRLLPKGLYLDKTIANARTELGWECDYEREAKACSRFADLVKDDSETFAVPRVYYEASGQDVLTAEFMNGKAVTKIPDLTQSERDHIGTQVLRLCLRELMEWRFMQTDPNWTNFLYNRQTRRIELLDFGASRDFPDRFVEPYVALLIAASKGDRAACKERSIELGYLTGRESSAMLKAHVDSILTLAEPFVESAPEVYDFKDQTITDRVRANIGLMLKERLAPPPEETYSLHRKLSGAFLLCARLQSQVRARDMFANAVNVWNGRAKTVQSP